MLNKRIEIKTASIEQIMGDAPPTPKPQFKVGTKFILNDKTWIVQRAWQDTGTQMRHVQSNYGDEEVMELHVLQKDAETPGFTFADMTETERLMLKAKRKSQGWDKDR